MLNRRYSGDRQTRIGDTVAETIQAKSPERDRETLMRALRARPPGSALLTVVGYLYLGQLARCCLQTMSGRKLSQGCAIKLMLSSVLRARLARSRLLETRLLTFGKSRRIDCGERRLPATTFSRCSGADRDRIPPGRLLVARHETARGTVPSGCVI